ncbi:type I-E CRISPR-associated protein Cas5/CasD [Pyramidobacter sp. SM-530-WT-4B]|uniref:Type I-E CRISPR-associated protein Cas5/CasD n=1 Tax=Pyramidobacter porci TaxID=2605789 RepID=A0A6L5YDH5_9BACT|nr:type I-E CRISPR-associated protein Cas5/CasD [Pyramidobacter porci]MST56311.1 type I-E CRISPR-associated protein Cas5/CasD [Pyramidobacter porci]
MKLLFLRLEGVMQSWGEHSKWDERDSALMPTKSGVVGLLACALGYPRGDMRINELSHKLNMAARADRAGNIMIDFHTVQGMPMLNSEGKKRSGNTITSHRQYLQDASFLVVLSGAEDILENCAAALESPVCPPFLGRKSCPPSLPMIADLNDRYASVEEALEQYPRADRSHGRLMTQREDPAGMAVRMDCLVSSAERRFARRNIIIGNVNPPEVNNS